MWAVACLFPLIFFVFLFFPFYICFLILPGVGEAFYFILRIRIVSFYFFCKIYFAIFLQKNL